MLHLPLSIRVSRFFAFEIFWVRRKIFFFSFYTQLKSPFSESTTTKLVWRSEFSFCLSDGGRRGHAHGKYGARRHQDKVVQDGNVCPFFEKGLGLIRSKKEALPLGRPRGTEKIYWKRTQSRCVDWMRARQTGQVNVKSITWEVGSSRTYVGATAPEKKNTMMHRLSKRFHANA